MRALALVVVAITAACGSDRQERPDECCPPPSEPLVPSLRTNEEGNCLQRWSVSNGCLHVSYDPALEVRSREIFDALAVWTAPDGLPCFDDPVSSAEPPGDGAHSLHFRHSENFVAQTTLLVDGSTGIVKQASISVPDEPQESLVEAVGRVLGLDEAPEGSDSVLGGMTLPTEADHASLAVVYGPDSVCE